MTPFQRLSAFFPDNAITHAERSYQQRSSKPLPKWRVWLNFAAKWATLTIALLMFGGLLIGSLTVRDPTPLVEKLNPLPNILIIVTLFYHFYLMFQTISLSANSIAREKESQTWDMLVLTGIDARQIVRGKWWATVQRQFPRYILLGLFRVGASAAAGLLLITIFNSAGIYYSSAGQLQLAHPISILISAVFAVALTVANLGLSAACGVMGSAISKSSMTAITRGIANQIVLSSLSALGISILLSFSPSTLRYNGYSLVGTSAVSLIDNGYTMTTNAMSIRYNYRTDAPVPPIISIEPGWIIAGLVTLVLYALLIWLVLWWAEKRAVDALATPAP